MSDLAKALAGLAPMTRDEVARQVKEVAWKEVSRMTEELAYWAPVPPGAQPGPARQEMNGWLAAARKLADEAQEILHPRKA